MRSDHPAWGKITPDPRPVYPLCPLCRTPMAVQDKDTAVLPVHRAPSYRLCFKTPITLAEARELVKFRMRAHP